MEWIQQYVLSTSYQIKLLFALLKHIIVAVKHASLQHHILPGETLFLNDGGEYGAFSDAKIFMMLV